ncbi:MAG: hypothetical protein IT336_12610 [Thermomicrobiales bacterium]|nr:hypothetical protein [Thermomicrobiales bacterium]
MSMGATVVTYAVEAANVEELHARVREYIVPAARRAAGYKGFILFDQGEGKRMAVVLYESAEAALAAQSIIGPEGRDHVYELLSSPSLGTLSTVVIADGLFAE